MSISMPCNATHFPRHPASGSFNHQYTMSMRGFSTAQVSHVGDNFAGTYVYLVVLSARSTLLGFLHRLTSAPLRHPSLIYLPLGVYSPVIFPTRGFVLRQPSCDRSYRGWKDGAGAEGSGRVVSRSHWLDIIAYSGHKA